MPIKVYKPVTPGVRHLRSIDRSELHKGAPWKPLVHGLSSKGGRNNRGRITMRRRGGGHKRSYRLIDFKRNKLDVWGVVERLEYDPNRTAFIALVKYEDGEYRYIIAPEGLKANDRVISGSQAKVKPGHANVIKDIPIGTTLHNIELNPGQGGKLARAAGSHAQLLGKMDNYAQLRLSSGEQRMIRSDCWATIGTVSNIDHLNINLGKAGRSRWLGRRPKVRGVAMNPHDHPHGGGEGKSSGGRHPVTPWGVCTKGKRTRCNPRTDKFIISRRKK